MGKSDPFIKLSIEQDNMIMDKDYGSQTSSTKKDELNPVYGETFHFTLPTLKNMVLKCKVMDDDIPKRANASLGMRWDAFHFAGSTKCIHKLYSL